MLFETCPKLTFGLSDVFVVTVVSRNRINGKNMPQSLVFWGNFNVVTIQNSLDGFRNTLNVGNNSKTSRWFPFIRSATSCNWILAVTEKVFVKPFAFKTLETYFLSSAFELSEDGRQSALLSKVLATDFLWQIGWWESKARYLSVWVSLR